jgi:hypothetical protein
VSLPAGLDRFARTYANWDGLRTVALTFDVDFAPEYMVEHVAGLLERYSARATFFATHPSRAVTALAASGVHEVGIHPNLSPTSTQGHGLADILARLRSAYPAARGNRFHLLAHAYRDLLVLSQEKLEYDVSALRFNCPYLLPAWHPDLGMVLMTYMWEDGICENAGLPMRLGSVDLKSPGLKIVNFHPMNVWINGADARARQAFLRENPDLTGCPRAVAERYREDGEGAERVLAALLDEVAQAGGRFVTLGEVVESYRAALPAPECV